MTARGRAKRPPPGEAGYATLAAVLLIAVLALAATGMVSATRSAVGAATAELGQARAAAAANAGVVLALNGLLSRDRLSRWSIDGRPHDVTFDGTRLRIRVEDERGKVPINALDEAMVQRLVAAAGLQGPQARIAAESLLDWTDDDDEPRLDGAEAPYYRRQQVSPRNGPLLSLDELLEVRGWTRAMVDRIRPFTSVSSGGGFDARFAQVGAIDVMLGDAGGPEALQRKRELAGQRTAIALTDDLDLTGRPLTIAVDAGRDDGARVRRRVVVELSRGGARPYLIRAYR